MDNDFQHHPHLIRNIAHSVVVSLSCAESSVEFFGSLFNPLGMSLLWNSTIRSIHVPAPPNAQTTQLIHKLITVLLLSASNTTQR